MLTRDQRYAVASTLSISDLNHVIRKITGNAYLSENERTEGVAFARTIDRYYTRRDGFVPKRVLNLLGA